MSARKEITVVFITKIMVLAAHLGVQSMLAWMLGPEGRGSYAVCMLLGTVLGVVFAVGTDRAAQYYAISGKLSLSQAVWVTLVITLLGSGIGVILGAALIQTPIGFFKKATPETFYISLSLIPLLVLVVTLQLQLSGMRKFAQVGIVLVCRNLFCGLLIALLVGSLGFGVKGALLAQAISALLTIALFLLVLRTSCGLTFVPLKWEHFHLILKYGLRYYPARIGHIIDQRVGVIVLALFATRKEIGFFTAASALVLRLGIFSQSIEAPLSPRIASDPGGRIKLVGQCIRLLFLFASLMAIVLVLVSYPLVKIVLSSAFLPSVPLIWVLAPALVFHGTSKILLSYFRATNRPGLCSFAIWTGMIANSLALIFLYPRIGLPSAAWAMLIGFTGRTLALLVSYQLITGKQVADLLRFRQDDFLIIKKAFSQFFNYVCIR